jgi:uncharacterized protein (TIGR02246 family)
MDTDNDDLAAIGQLVDDAQAQQFSVEPFLELHTDDVVIVNFAGRRVAGKDSLRDAMSAALASPLAKVTTTMDVHDVVLIRPDVAVVNATKHVHDQRDGGEASASSGTTTYVVVREPEAGWRIAVAQTTPIAGT